MRSLLALCFFLSVVAATTHDLNWRLGTVYSEQTGLLGDSWRVLWSGSHNVWQFPSPTAYDQCDFSKATQLASTSVNQFILQPKQPGTYFLACQMGRHCASGMKVKVTVMPPGQTTTPTQDLPSITSSSSSSVSSSGSTLSTCSRSCIATFALNATRTLSGTAIPFQFFSPDPNLFPSCTQINLSSPPDRIRFRQKGTVIIGTSIQVTNEDDTENGEADFFYQLNGRDVPFTNPAQVNAMGSGGQEGYEMATLDIGLNVKSNDFLQIFAVTPTSGVGKLFAGGYYSFITLQFFQQC